MILFPSTKRNGKGQFNHQAPKKNGEAHPSFLGAIFFPQQKTSVSPEVEIDHFQGGRFPNVADALGCHCVCAGGDLHD